MEEIANDVESNHSSSQLYDPDSKRKSSLTNMEKITNDVEFDYAYSEYLEADLNYKSQLPSDVSYATALCNCSILNLQSSTIEYHEDGEADPEFQVIVYRL